MSYKILCLGKTKEDWIRQGITEYQKRLEAVWKMQLVELGDVSLKIAGSINKVKSKEAVIIQKALLPGDFVFALDEHGSQHTSNAFALNLDEISTTRDIVFVIGGVYGLDKSVLERADEILSFSRFTYPHQLIRIILMEQLYRAWTIRSGKTYHY